MKTMEKQKLRPHQTRALNDAVKGLRTTDREQIIMACGTGKTLMQAHLAKRLKARRVLSAERPQC